MKVTKANAILAGKVVFAMSLFFLTNYFRTGDIFGGKLLKPVRKEKSSNEKPSNE